MADSNHSSSPCSGRRRWLTALNSLAAIVLCFALVVMVNYLSAGHFIRRPWVKNFSGKLSPLTVNILQGLTNDVKITLFFQPHGDEEDLYTLASSLLVEYQNVNPKRIQVKTLDDTRFPGEGKALLARLKLTEINKDRDTSRNFVLIECNGHSKVIFSKKLASYDLSQLMSGKSREVPRNAFRGETLFTSAIFTLSNAQQFKAYFITGHDEHSPLTSSSADNGGAVDDNSYSKLATLLDEEMSCSWQTLSLQGTNAVPADCRLMIIAGARRSFGAVELGKIDAYLKQGGRLMVMLDEDISLGQVLAKWGVVIGKNYVVEHDSNYQNSLNDSFLTAGLGDHPITNPLRRDHLPIRIVRPIPVFGVRNFSKTPGAPEVATLASSSPSSTYGNEVGSFPVITAVEQGVIRGVNAGGTRIVVAGDSVFLCDKMIYTEEANHYFASYAVDWLLERPDILFNEISPHPITVYKLFMTKSQATTVRWLFLAGLPGAALFIGFLVWLRRRS